MFSFPLLLHLYQDPKSPAIVWHNDSFLAYTNIWDFKLKFIQFLQLSSNNLAYAINLVPVTPEVSQPQDSFPTIVHPPCLVSGRPSDTEQKTSNPTYENEFEMLFFSSKNYLSDLPCPEGFTTARCLVPEILIPWPTSSSPSTVGLGMSAILQLLQNQKTESEKSKSEPNTDSIVNFLLKRGFQSHCRASFAPCPSQLLHTHPYHAGLGQHDVLGHRPHHGATLLGT